MGWALLMAALAAAEPVSLPGTRVVHLRSKLNGVSYRLSVSLPPDFDARDVEYPLVLLLDADYSFPIAHAVATHLRERSDLPDLAVVAIGYDGPPQYQLNRTRDYTPTHVAEGGYGAAIQRVSGGGGPFLDFIARELLPFLHARFRTAPRPVLVGHSYGGLLALWAMMSRPGVFGGFIAVSPSLFYDDHLVARLEKEAPPLVRTVPVRLYAAVGALEGNPAGAMARDLLALGAAFTRERYPRLEAQVEVLDGETHNSVFPRALSNGLRFFWPRGSFTPSQAPGTRPPGG